MSKYYSVIEGFKKDCLILFNRFFDTGRCDFQTFVKIWQDMKFPLVFCGHNLAELTAFTEHVLFVAKNYIIANKNSSLGPFYLLYSLYYKQPTKTCCIRVTFEEREFLINTTHEYYKKGYHLPAYMLCKMETDRAFFHVFESKVFGVDQQFKRCLYKCYGGASRRENIETDLIKKKIFNSGWYAKWKDLEDVYNKHKMIVQHDREKEEIVQTYKLVLTDFLGQLKKESGITDEISQDVAPKNEAASSSDIGTNRVNLKNRIYKEPVVFNKYESRRKPSENGSHESHAADAMKSESSRAGHFNPESESDMDVDSETGKLEHRRRGPGNWKHYLKNEINEGCLFIDLHSEESEESDD